MNIDLSNRRALNSFRERKTKEKERFGFITLNTQIIRCGTESLRQSEMALLEIPLAINFIGFPNSVSWSIEKQTQKLICVFFFWVI